MERNIMGELDMYRQAGTRPNFSAVARKYGLDRHTVSKYWRSGGQVEDARRARPSGFDQVRDVIETKAQLPGTTVKGIHEYLLDRHADKNLPGYRDLVHYMGRRGIACGVPDGGPEPHPRYETAPGRQMQFDWKEDVTMHDRRGRAYRFSVFSATLGASRLHRFRYVRTRTTDDLLRCLLSVAVANGGWTQEALTDNMSALVVTGPGGRRSRVERAWRFADDAGFSIRLCAPRSPETKGKDESANRFLSRLMAYEGDFEDEAELVAIIARVEARSNAEPNATTGVPPMVLFMRDEKEALLPLGNVRLLEERVGDVSHQVVPPTMLVRAAGREWSVPRRCIGRRAKLLLMPGGQLVVSVDGEVVATHDTTAPAGPINYSEAHYAEALAAKAAFADRDIAEAARENLAMLDRLGSIGGGA